MEGGGNEMDGDAGCGKVQRYGVKRMKGSKDKLKESAKECCNCANLMVQVAAFWCNEVHGSCRLDSACCNRDAIFSLFQLFSQPNFRFLRLCLYALSGLAKACRRKRLLQTSSKLHVCAFIRAVLHVDERALFPLTDLTVGGSIYRSPDQAGVRPFMLCPSLFIWWLLFRLRIPIQPTSASPKCAKAAQHSFA